MSAGDWKDLYTAVMQGDTDLVAYHVREGVNLNYQHPEILMTPLVTAIEQNKTEIALLLLENGADPLVESYYHNLNALEAAHKFRNQTLIQKLKSLGHHLGLKKKLTLWLARSIKK